MLLESVKNRIMRIFADSGYDSKAIFDQFGSKAVIPSRKNTSSQGWGSNARARIVRHIGKTSEKNGKILTNMEKDRMLRYISLV